MITVSECDSQSHSCTDSEDSTCNILWKSGAGDCYSTAVHVILDYWTLTLKSTETGEETGQNCSPTYCETQSETDIS